MPGLFLSIASVLSFDSEIFLLTARNFKLLNPMACLVPYANLRDEDVALGIDRHGVAMRKFTSLMSRAAEGREEFPTAMIENIDLLVLFIQDEHEPLRLIGRKTYPTRGPPRARQVSGPGRLGSLPIIGAVSALFLVRDENVFLKVPYLIEHLDTIAPAVAHVHQTAVVNRYTVRHLHESVAFASLRFCLRAL
jgi:hypothetical protein